MRKRIRKKWDLSFGNSGSLIVLSGSFLLGGLIGCLFASLSSGQGAQELSEYLKDYLILAQQNAISGSLWPILFDRMKYLLAAGILGFTALGILGLPVLFGSRGFFLSFSTGCFCKVFGSIGMLPAVILFGLPALLWVPSLFLLGVPSFAGAQELLNRLLNPCTGGRGGFSIGAGELCRFGLCVGLNLACVFLEYWAVPVLLTAAARVVL